MTKVAVAKWGNNLALRLPKAAAEAMGVVQGSELQLVINDGVLIATPLRKKTNLQEMVRRITPRNRHDATDWGSPVGREVW